MSNKTFFQIARDVEDFIHKKYMNKDNLKQSHISHLVETPKNYLNIACLRFSPDGEEIAVGYKSGELQEIEKRSGKVLWTKTVSCTGLTCLKYCMKAPFIFMCDGIGNVLMQKKDTDTNYILNDDLKDVYWFDVNGVSQNLICGGLKGDIQIVELPSCKVTKKFKANLMQHESTKYHKMQVTNIVSVPNHSEIFVSSSLESVVKIWDLRTKRGWVADIRGPYITGDSLDVMQEKILTGSNRFKNCLQLWDIRTIKLLSTINPLNELDNYYGQYVECCKFLKNPPKNYLILCEMGGLGYLSVINPTEYRTLSRFSLKQRMRITSIDSYGKDVAYGGSRNIVIIGSYK